jgi:hypothetical protein
VLAVAIIGGFAALLQALVGMADTYHKVFPRHVTSPPRSLHAAYDLGFEIFPAAFAESLNLSPKVIAHSESNVRADLSLLNLSVPFPPRAGGQQAVNVLHEQIRPKIAGRNNDLLDWFDYGFYWSGEEMGLAIMYAYSSPRAPGDKVETQQALRSILVSIQDESSRHKAEKVEQRIELKQSLRRRSSDLWNRIEQIREPFDRSKLKSLLSKIDEYHDDVSEATGAS